MSFVYSREDQHTGPIHTLVTLHCDLGSNGYAHNSHLHLSKPFSPGLQAKWGPRQEGQSHCAVEVKEPITGNMTLPQQPFGNLGYLQRFWVQEDPFFDRLPILAGLGRPVEAEYYGAAAAPKAAASQSAGKQQLASLKPVRSGFQENRSQAGAGVLARLLVWRVCSSSGVFDVAQLAPCKSVTQASQGNGLMLQHCNVAGDLRTHKSNRDNTVPQHCFHTFASAGRPVNSRALMRQSPQCATSRCCVP